MKRIVCLLIVTGLISGSFCYSLYGSPGRIDKGNIGFNGSESVTTPVKGDFDAYQRDSSSRKVTANSRLDVLESLEGNRVTDGRIFEPRVIVRRYRDDRNNYQREEEESYRGSRHFRGHLSGLEFGISNYRFENSMSIPDEISYMTLNTSCSNAFNIYFSQLSIGFSERIGLVTGIGLGWNKYRFEYNNSITVGPDGFITGYVPDSPVPVKRSKFSVLYLNVPALLEFQIPAGYRNHLNVAAGVVGGLKLNAWTKVVFDDKERNRSNGNYNLNLLRGGFTARAGYQNFMIYGTYYVSPWFQDLKGPNGFNLEPFEIGVAFTFND